MLNLVNEPYRWGRTLKTYLILICCAMNRKTITYGELGRWTNDIARNVSPRHLDPIYRYCEDRKLPRLAVLGVSQGSGDPGVPGDSYPGPRETIAADREEVFGYDWFNVAPPTVDELRQFGN